MREEAGRMPAQLATLHSASSTGGARTPKCGTSGGVVRGDGRGLNRRCIARAWQSAVIMDWSQTLRWHVLLRMYRPSSTSECCWHVVVFAVQFWLHFLDGKQQVYHWNVQECCAHGLLPEEQVAFLSDRGQHPAVL